jgi:RNA polymerase sigma factor (sigma-70 family)
MEQIRVMLVDDHDIVRTGLKAFLDTQDGINVVSEASSGEEAVRLAQEVRPSVIVMDITMPGMSGLEATRRVVDLCLDCKVLVLTVHNDQQYFFEMMTAGAAGYVTKQAAADELVDAIRAVAHGQVYLQPVLARWLLDDYRRVLGLYEKQEAKTTRRTELASGLDKLSKREIQVLKMVSNGLSNTEIGQKLEISPKTVARHRERIMDKLDIHSTTELVKFAIRTGMVDIS